MKFFESQLVRRILLPILARVNAGDITIRHHHTGDPVRLHSFRHKGYWFHGRNRERSSMELFRQLIKQGDNVVEIGGHIGYMSLFFRHLAGPGHVFVFEPGENNLPYIRRNIKDRGIELIEKGAGDRTGVARFFIESLTGQNNSFIEDFEALQANQRDSFLRDVDVRAVEVEMVRLDDWAKERGIRVDFMKIDVEGFEWSVLQGMLDILGTMRPGLMVEVQREHREIFDLLTHKGYLVFGPTRVLYDAFDQMPASSNVFALHREAHREPIDALGLHRTPAS